VPVVARVKTRAMRKWLAFLWVALTAIFATRPFAAPARSAGVGAMGKARERQIILRTELRTLLLELGLGGKFQAKSGWWDENRPFSKAMFLKLQYAMAAGC
jgi:hypothetical protein